MCKVFKITEDVWVYEVDKPGLYEVFEGDYEGCIMTRDEIESKFKVVLP